MAMAPCRYTLKMIAKRWQSKSVITSMGLGFTIFCSVSSDNLLVVIYTFLSLVLTIDFCYSQLIFSCNLFKKDKISKKKKKKNSEINEFIIHQVGVPLLSFEGGPGVPVLNFWEYPGVPFLNLRGIPGPTFKL